MKLISKLALCHMEKNRKRTFLTAVIIVLLVTIITAVIYFAFNSQHTLQTTTKTNAGDRREALLNETSKQSNSINVEQDMMRSHDMAKSVIEAAMSADNIPAMSVAVLRDNEIVYTEAFGFSNIETGEAALPKSKFRLGSVSKVFSADLAVILAREGIINLDVDIRTYVPDFPDKGSVITLRQLLGHLGGIRHYNSSDLDFLTPGNMIDWRFYPDTASILALFANDPLVAAPGEKSSYSTFGYSLVGLALENATGKKYFELVEEKILAPAGIRDIAVDNMFVLVPNRVQYYDPIALYGGLLAEDVYGSVVNAAPLNSDYKIPGGGLVGSAEAVVRFGSLHLPGGPLSETAFPELFQLQKTNSGIETGTALGWRISQDDFGRRTFNHAGAQQGGRSFLSIYPDDGLVISLLSNMGARPEYIEDIGCQIADAFLDKE